MRFNRLRFLCLCDDSTFSVPFTCSSGGRKTHQEYFTIIAFGWNSLIASLFELKEIIFCKTWFSNSVSLTGQIVTDVTRVFFSISRTRLLDTSPCEWACEETRIICCLWLVFRKFILLRCKIGQLFYSLFLFYWRCTRRGSRFVSKGTENEAWV